LRYLLFLILQ